MLITRRDRMAGVKAATSPSTRSSSSFSRATLPSGERSVNDSLISPQWGPERWSELAPPPNLSPTVRDLPGSSARVGSKECRRRSCMNSVRLVILGAYARGPAPALLQLRLAFVATGVALLGLRPPPAGQGPPPCADRHSPMLGPWLPWASNRRHVQRHCPTRKLQLHQGADAWALGLSLQDCRQPTVSRAC